MKPNLLISLAAIIFLTGCNYNIPQNPVVENTNVPIQKSQSQIDEENRLLNENPLIFTTTSEYKTIPCNGREIEILQEATSNTVKLTGECKKVTVDGVSNKVTVDKVGEIIVNGTSNRVVYGEGLEGKKPKITKTGVSNFVESAKEANNKNEKK